MSATLISDRAMRLQKFVRLAEEAGLGSKLDAACDVARVENDDLRWLGRLLEAIAHEDAAAIERLRAHWNVP